MGFGIRSLNQIKANSTILKMKAEMGLVSGSDEDIFSKSQESQGDEEDELLV